MRGLVSGVGINDADYPVAPRGKPPCIFYETWRAMLKRCYSDKRLATHPTYIGCSVCPDWLLFSSFSKWMKTQDFEGNHLDKDLYIPGNKVYSDESCLFIDGLLNNALRMEFKKSSGLPTGVSLTHRKTPYRASLYANGKNNYLGVFTTVQKAESVYIHAKVDYLLSFKSSSDERQSVGLERYCNVLLEKLVTNYGG